MLLYFTDKLISQHYNEEEDVKNYIIIFLGVLS